MQKLGILQSKGYVYACIFLVLSLDIIYYRLNASLYSKTMLLNTCYHFLFKWENWKMDSISIGIRFAI
jgi:hypothetical protein